MHKKYFFKLIRKIFSKFMHRKRRPYYIRKYIINYEFWLKKSILIYATIKNIFILIL